MNLQIARELRLRDIGGIIVVDFIDMMDDCKYIMYIELFIVRYFTSICFYVIKIHMYINVLCTFKF